MVEVFMQTYSEYNILREMVLKMIELDENKRLDAIELKKYYKKLKTYYDP